MANFWSSTFSIINRSYFWGLSSYKSIKNSTSRGSSKVKILAFVVIFTACTIGGEEPQGVVTIESTTATTIVDEETTFEEGVLEFAQCMREEGINFPDPTFDIDGNPQFDNLEIENEEEFESAFENCEDILRNALPEQFDLDPEVEAALVDASLEFSQCMRDQGIDFPDPKPGEFGFFAFRDADIDFSSEAVQEAFEICQPENPLENLDD
jgi:Homoserine dehydrogenase